MVLRHIANLTCSLYIPEFFNLVFVKECYDLLFTSTYSYKVLSWCTEKEPQKRSKLRSENFDFTIFLLGKTVMVEFYKLLFIVQWRCQPCGIWNEIYVYVAKDKK